MNATYFALIYGEKLIPLIVLLYAMAIIVWAIIVYLLVKWWRGGKPKK